MTKLLFNIIFEGDILPGHKQTTVQPKLAKIFGMEAEEASQLFSGKQHKIKSRVSTDKAKQYIYAMAKLGAMAYMLPVTGESPQAPEAVDGKFTETGSFDVSAYSSFFSQKEEDREEPEERSIDHKIFNLDIVDNELSQKHNIENDISGLNELSGPHEVSGLNKIMEINEITKKVIDQKAETRIQHRSENIMDIEEVAKQRSGKDPDPDEISGVQKIMDLKEVGKAVKKHKET